MLKLARAIHLDESDMNVYHSPARTGEWCVTGGFEFSDWTEADLVGKARQAFANGWLGVETFGRVTFVAVTPVERGEFDRLVERLSEHFVRMYGAPSVDAARGVAAEELNFMAEICTDHDDNTLLTLQRELTHAGVKESIRSIEASPADLSQLAVHSTPNGKQG